jgi:hypothetical protein
MPIDAFLHPRFRDRAIKLPGYGIWKEEEL